MSSKSTANGSVLKIERSSIHDGCGLRTVLFLKGCSLSCAWCSTPESQQSEREKGYAKQLCQACSRCISACPSGAISLSADRSEVITDQDKCTACFSCAEVCPSNAIKKYGLSCSADEIMEEVTKDEIFYFYSGGGLTISGGEPLCQAEFTAEILKKCKRLGIHTALESSFHLPFDKIAMVLPWLDSLYVDIKHMDNRQHTLWTGEGNTLILENIKKADYTDLALDIIVRIPLIPGFNDSDQNLRRTALFCADLKKLKEIELLPYHRLGSDTYGHLGLEYRCRDLVPPSPEHLMERAEYLKGKISTVLVRAGSGFIEA
jgi:pyruvate formate lyase activating enzyme